MASGRKIRQGFGMQDSGFWNQGSYLPCADLTLAKQCQCRVNDKVLGWSGRYWLLVTGCGLGRSAGIFPSQIDPNNAVSIAIVLSPRGVTIAELLPWEAAPPPFRRTTERIPVRILDQFGPRQLTHALNHKLRQSTQRRGPINARHPLNERNAMQTFK